MAVSHLQRKALSRHPHNKNFVKYARMLNADYKNLERKLRCYITEILLHHQDLYHLLGTGFNENLQSPYYKRQTVGTHDPSSASGERLTL